MLTLLFEDVKVETDPINTEHLLNNIFFVNPFDDCQERELVQGPLPPFLFPSEAKENIIFPLAENGGAMEVWGLDATIVATHAGNRRDTIHGTVHPWPYVAT